MKSARDHGGDMSQAIRQFGGQEDDWIDLSTGINRRPYRVDNISEYDWRSLPRADATQDLLNAAQTAFQTKWPMLALPGAQAVIQLLPQVTPQGEVRILSPTYNEFAGAFIDSERAVEAVNTFDALKGADLAILVNPNNPTGTTLDAASLAKLAQNVGMLVVDESFADVTPDISLLPQYMPENCLVLRSFGKFFGLAGVRLGFAAGPEEILARMARRVGPWPVSGPALAIGALAYRDTAWQEATRRQLAQDRSRLDQIANAIGWELVGGTDLFRLYHTSDAQAARTRLAKAHIWSRIFPYSENWIRLGLPGTEQEWARLEAALS